jgi:hypothetical protein
VELPCSFDLEGVQAFGFAFGEWVLDDFVDAAAAWPAMERGAQFGEAFGGSGDDDFNVAVFGVADPAFQFQFAGFSVDEPAKAYALHPSPHQKMLHHIWFPRSVLNHFKVRRAGKSQEGGRSRRHRSFGIILEPR